MRRAGPYRGENPGPGKDVKGELEPSPGIREHSGAEKTGKHLLVLSGECPLESAESLRPPESRGGEAEQYREQEVSPPQPDSRLPRGSVGVERGVLDAGNIRHRRPLRLVRQTSFGNLLGMVSRQGLQFQCDAGSIEQHHQAYTRAQMSLK